MKPTYEELERYVRQADITIENLEQKLAASQREFRAADATIENLQMQVEKLASLEADGSPANEGTITATLFKPVADLYEVTVPGGRSTTFTKDAAEASDCRVMGWSVQKYVRLERYQAAMLQGAEPVSNRDELPEVVLHMGQAMSVFEALKKEVLYERVRHAELGVMGAVNVQVWTSVLGGTLRYETSNGGCTLRVIQAPPKHEVK